jgi:hypothetical protein
MERRQPRNKLQQIITAKGQSHYCSSGSENYHASPSINGSEFSSSSPRTIRMTTVTPHYCSSGGENYSVALFTVRAGARTITKGMILTSDSSRRLHLEQ